MLCMNVIDNFCLLSIMPIFYKIINALLKLKKMTYWFKGLIGAHAVLFTGAYYAWNYIYEDHYDDDDEFMLDEDGNIVYREKYEQ